MRKYKLEQPVNWKRVLWVMRKSVERDIGNMKWYRRGVIKKPSTWKYLYRELKGNLEAYQALRKFLRYSVPTKIEKEVEDLLRPLPITSDKK